MKRDLSVALVAICVSLVIPTSIENARAQGRVDTIIVPPVPALRPSSKPQEDLHRIRSERNTEMRVAVWPFGYGTNESKGGIVASERWWLQDISNRNTQNESVLATDTVVEALTRSPFGRLDVLDRSFFAPILAERRIELKEMDTVESMLRAGELMTATHVVTGRCVPLAEKGDLAISLRLIDVKSRGKIISSASDSCSDCDGKRLRNVVLRLTRKLFVPTRGLDDPSGWTESGLPGSKD